MPLSVTSCALVTADEAATSNAAKAAVNPYCMMSSLRALAFLRWRRLFRHKKSTTACRSATCWSHNCLARPKLSHAAEYAAKLFANHSHAFAGAVVSHSAELVRGDFLGRSRGLHAQTRALEIVERCE